MKNKTRELVDAVCSGKAYSFEDLQKELRLKSYRKTSRDDQPNDVVVDAIDRLSDFRKEV